MNRLRQSCLLVWLLAVSLGCATAGPSPGRFELVVLGIAQDGAVPHFGCSKPCCVNARKQGLALHPASVAVHDRQTGKLLLIEATPAVEAQVAMLHRHTGLAHRGRKPVDAILITHAHIGHYLGLAHFGTEVASTDKIPLHVSRRMHDYLRGHGPWRQLLQRRQIEVRSFTPGEEFEPLPGLRVTPISVPHRDEFSDTMAFKIRGPRASVLFVPDVDAWHKQPGLLASLLDGVDVAYLDATFYDGRELPGRDITQVPHPPMVDTMRRLAAQAKDRPGRLRFIHLNHTNPALFDRDIRRSVEARGFGIAAQGEVVGL